MNIKAGNYYIARNGELVGPMGNFSEFYMIANQSIYSRRGTATYYDLDIIDTVDNAARKHVEGK